MKTATDWRASIDRNAGWFQTSLDSDIHMSGFVQDVHKVYSLHAGSSCGSEHLSHVHARYESSDKETGTICVSIMSVLVSRPLGHSSVHICVIEHNQRGKRVD